MSFSRFPFIDIGANLTNSRFHSDLPELLQRAYDAGVVHMIVTGTSMAASQAALALAERYCLQLTCTVGVHPHDAKHWDEHSARHLTKLANHPRVVAIGECGLDFNRNFSPRQAQIACFEAQLELAVQCKKPVFLHDRDAHRDFVAILKRYRDALPGALVHCFTGTRDELRAYLDLDCHIGITGWISDPRRGAALREAVKILPHSRVMIETDAPFLLPFNVEHKPVSRRNEPAFLPAVFSSLVELWRADPAILAQQIWRNTVEFFGLTIRESREI